MGTSDTTTTGTVRGSQTDLQHAHATPTDEQELDSRVLRFLGVAFLVQAIASALSGLVLAPVDLLADSAPDDMAATMAEIVDGERLLRASIVGEMVTAFGIVALGTLLYFVVRRHGRILATIALGLYLVEVGLLAVREALVFGLWSTSRQAAGSGVTAELTAQATTLYEMQAFAYSLHTLAFAAGATIFYLLLARSALLPRVLIGLGLVAAPLALVGQTLVLLGIDVPLYVFLPNLPFELAAGLWFLLRGRPTRAGSG